MSNTKTLIGRKFGRLTVVEKTNRKIRGIVVYKCKCDCGNEKMCLSDDLTGGKICSCGCKRIEVALKNSQKALEYLDQNERKEGTQLNSLTSKLSKRNKSGHKGVLWYPKNNKWGAYITFQHKKIHLGLFADIEDAIKARKRAEEQYFEPVLNKYGRELI